MKLLRELVVKKDVKDLKGMTICKDTKIYVMKEGLVSKTLEKPVIFKSNWKEIEEKIKEESEAEDCMIPYRDRRY